MLNPFLHGFVRAKQYYLTVTFTLALTLSMMISVFALVDLVFFQPLPYPAPQQLHQLRTQVVVPNGGFDGGNPQFIDYFQSTFDPSMQLAAYHSWSEYKLTDRLQRPSVPVRLATGNLFSVLAVQPHLGRLFDEREQTGNQQPSVLLGYRAWQTHFDGAADVVGQKVQLNKRRFNVVGVLPDNLVLPDLDNINDVLWLPMDMDESLQIKGSQALMGGYKLIMRASNGALPAEFEQEFERLTQEAGQLYMPGTLKSFDIASKLTSVEQALRGDSGALVLMLLAGVSALLVIALINLSGMQMARAIGRSKAVAVSFAFGASSRQIMLDAFKHNLLVVGLAVLLGLGLAMLSVGQIRILAADSIARLDTLSLSLSTVLFCVLLAGLIAWLFSYIELKAVKEDQLMASLQASGKGVGKQISAGVSHLLMALQIGLSFVVLAVTCHVVLLTLGEALKETGVTTENRWSLTLDYRNIERGEARLNLHRSVVRTLEQLPAVSTVSHANVTRPAETVNINMVEDEQGRTLANAQGITLAPGYFELMGMPVNGAGFQNGDELLEAYPVMVNQRLAQSMNADPSQVIGSKIKLGDELLHPVIGIVNNVSVPGSPGKEVPEHYRATGYGGDYRHTYVFVGSESLDAAQLAVRLASRLQALDPRLDIADFRSAQALFDQYRQRHLSAAGVAIALALVALLMVVAGVSGIVSYMLRSRRYSLGVKLAMGAGTSVLFKESFKELLAPVLMALWMAFCLLFMLSGYALSQPAIELVANWSLIGTLLLAFLALVLLVAYFPIRQVLAGDPLQALRND
ncbi:ABC transporter permease [Ferrimonas pelagia]|uniref:ABC transporter permease n=1 Tax=Ferrimonas pelagia TaxID=1177826 RepID=A0ABP9FBZ8_9GAMM